MAISEQEAVASLHILVAVAQADGSIHDDEKEALTAALAGIEVLEGVDVEPFLSEKVDLEQEVGLLLSSEAKEATFRSAFSLAHADGACSPEEEVVLDRLKGLLQIDDARAAEIKRVFVEAQGGSENKSIYQRIDDPEARRAMVSRLILKDSVMSAVMGLFPFPIISIATDLAVVAMQVNLIRDIGALWGREIDKSSAKGLLATFGLGTGARLAVSNIVKFLPGWGSLVGATTSFAATYAVGKVMEKHFENAEGDEIDASKLKAEFASAEKEGKDLYKAKKDEIAAKEAEVKAKLVELGADLKEGRITQAEFEDRASKL